MEAYDQRYDVAVYSTVERPEFLLYVILLVSGIIVEIHIVFLRLLWRHLFPKRRDPVSSALVPSLLTCKLLVQAFSVCHPSYPWCSFGCRLCPCLGIFSFYVCLCQLTCVSTLQYLIESWGRRRVNFKPT